MDKPNVKFSARKTPGSLYPADIRLSPGGRFFESSSKTMHYVNDRTITEGVGAGSSNDP
jgi:hypothetical protein